MYVTGCRIDVRVPDCLLYTAAVHKDIFLPGMTVVVAGHLYTHIQKSNTYAHQAKSHTHTEAEQTTTVTKISILMLLKQNYIS